MTEHNALLRLTDNELRSLEQSLSNSSGVPLSAVEIERLATAMGLPSTRDKSGRLTDAQFADKLACEISLHAFIRSAWGIVEPDTPFVDGPHIWALSLHFEALVTGDVQNLLVAIPPGCMKSLAAAVFFPAWVWTTNPGARFMFASYDQSLSTRDSIRCRAIVESEWYRQQWGDRVSLVGDQNEKTRFDTRARGWRIATSVGGRGTGEHPDYLIVDDPLNAKRAMSETERRSCVAWWDGTMTTRGEVRNVRRAVIAQRLAPADLHGHILEVDAGVDEWEYLMLPMRFEESRRTRTSIGWTDWRTSDGQLLWEAVYDERKVRRLERSLGSKRAAGQLQQRPVSLEGEVFHREWFEIVDAAPAQARRVRYWDRAGTEGSGKYTAGVRMSVAGGMFYVENVRRARLSFGRREQLIKQTAELDDAEHPGAVRIWLEQEPGSGGKDSAAISVRLLAGYDAHADVVSGQGNKVARAQPLAAQAEAGNVKLVRGDWNAEYLDELEAFPGGEFSDQVDASSGAFNRLALGSGDGGLEGDIVASGEDDEERTPFDDAELEAMDESLRELVTSMRELRSGGRRTGGRRRDADD